jgi:hypothetical protein
MKVKNKRELLSESIKTVSVMTTYTKKWVISPGLLVKEKTPAKEIKAIPSTLF